MLALLTPRVMLIAVAGLAASTGLQTLRLSWAKTDLIAERSAATQLAAGLTSANLTIDQLAAANDQLQQLAAAQRGAVTRAVKSLAETERKLQESRTKLRAREDADRAIPECEALLRTDLGVCPGHVDGMRRRASGL